MTPELVRRREELLDLQSRLRTTAAGLEHELSLDDESGELPAWGTDELADHASATYGRELDDTLEENAELILREIETALSRIEDGTYGTCEVCGNEIPEERLEAVPYATVCIEDKRRLERG